MSTYVHKAPTAVGEMPGGGLEAAPKAPKRPTMCRRCGRPEPPGGPAALRADVVHSLAATLPSGLCTCFICTGCSLRRKRLEPDQSTLCGYANHCAGCCNCYHCESPSGAAHWIRALEENNISEERHASAEWCPQCGVCAAHCACFSCSTCGSRGTVGNRCARCEPTEGAIHHRQCCERFSPGTATAIHFINRKPYFWAGGVVATNRSRRFIAVELEICGLKEKEGYRAINDVLHEWKCAVVHDGSINRANGGGGWEINTSPASGDAFTAELAAIGKALNAGKAYVNDSCGAHVHIDCRDLYYYDLRKVILLYAHLEPAIFAMLPMARRDNRYARPCADFLLGAAREDQFVAPGLRDKDGHVVPPDHGKASAKLKSTFIGELAKSIYGDAGMARAARTVKGQGEVYRRFNAFNVHSWFYRRTLEWRHHQGTVNWKQIHDWGVMLATLTDQAVRMPVAEIQDLIKQKAKPKETLLRLLAPEGCYTDGLVSIATKRLEAYQHEVVPPTPPAIVHDSRGAAGTMGGWVINANGRVLSNPISVPLSSRHGNLDWSLYYSHSMHNLRYILNLDHRDCAGDCERLELATRQWTVDTTSLVSARTAFEATRGWISSTFVSQAPNGTLNTGGTWTSEVTSLLDDEPSLEPEEEEDETRLDP